MHLAYDIAEGYDTIIVVDAAPAGGEPGSIVVTEVDASAHPAATPLFDAHGMQPHAVFGVLDMLGTRPARIIVVGCQPGSTGYHIGLSEPVEAAVGRAVQVVMDLLAETGPGPLPQPRPGPAPPPAAQCGQGHAPGERMRAGGPGQPSRGQLP
jgi:hydrogenase maturation protease